MARTQGWWFVLLLTLALLLAACGGAVPAAAPAEADTVGEAAAPDSGRCGDTSQLSDTVNFYNWSDYIDEEILTQFEEECGVQVVYDTFSSNEDMLAKLQGGATGYDLIVPSDYMVSIMIQLGLLKELDPANIPNMANIAERFRDPEFDPGNKYSVPYQWGTTGLGFDLDAVGIVGARSSTLPRPKNMPARLACSTIRVRSLPPRCCIWASTPTRPTRTSWSKRNRPSSPSNPMSPPLIVIRSPICWSAATPN
jgi:spermidine/putrescine-binding protein